MDMPLNKFLIGGSMDGEVANFVETEMILTQPGGGHVAHVQLRGSLPLPWSQPSDLSWQPIIEVHQGNLLKFRYVEGSVPPHGFDDEIPLFFCLMIRWWRTRISQGYMC